jgi:hypothetical protein
MEDCHMGYFSSGTEGMDYQEQFCFHCANWRDRGDGCGEGCAIWDTHLMHNGETEKVSVLNDLIPRDGIYNGECALFLRRDG